MAIEGLTQQQNDFIQRFLKVPWFQGREVRKQQRRAAIEQFRSFNAACNLLREDILALEDNAIKSALLTRLSAAEEIIKADPEALDFEGGHGHLDALQPVVESYLLRQLAERAHNTAAGRMQALGAQSPGPGVQSDIGLIWLFIEEKFEEGMATNAREPLESALRALARLEALLDLAEAEAANPFAETDPALGGGRAAAMAGLSETAQAARRRLLEIFNQLETLRARLAARFGEESVPLALRIGLSTTGNKLDAAADAAPGDLPGHADEAGAALDEVQRAARDMLAASEAWAQDHAAFRLRYDVMLAHPMKGDTEFVQPAFAGITGGYDAACAKAAQHDYLEASQDLSVLRHDLKDVLDFADDCASFDALHAERTTLLASLPAPDSYVIERLKEDDTAARALLPGAVALRRDGQMAAALAQLNRIVGAVDDILEVQKFALQHKEYDTACGTLLTALEGEFDAEVKALIAADVAQAVTDRAAAQEDADRGAYRSATAQAVYLYNRLHKLKSTAGYLTGYVTERAELARRLAEAEGRAGPEGGEAITGYLEMLRENEARRASAEGSGDFKMAKAMCLRLKGAHEAQMDLADQAKAYLAEKATYDTELARLAGLAGTEAALARETAAKLLAQAGAASASGNWLVGTSLLRNAVLEIRRGISDAETAALIDGLQGAVPPLTGENADYHASYAEFEKIVAHVNGLDTEGAFMMAMIDAEFKAQNAEDVLAADPEAAQQLLDEAISDCRAVARQVTLAASFDSYVSGAEALIKQAGKVNKKGRIDAETQAAQEALDAARAAAQEPDPEIETGIAKLGEAEAAARRGIAAMACYQASLRPVRLELKDMLKTLGADPVATYMTSFADRIRALRAEMMAAFDARELQAATAKSAEALEYSQSLGSVLDECLEALTFKADKIDGKFSAATMAHAATVLEAAEINRLVNIMNDALDDGQFATALYNAKKARSLYFAARRKARAVDAYLLVKTPCTEKLTLLEDRRAVDAGALNDQVEALRATYDGAVRQEEAGNFHGAQKRLEGFAAACDPLSDAYDVFDRCLLHKTRAQAAFDALGPLRIPAIEPLYARLDGKNENAKRRMAQHDFETAATLFRELEADCADASAAKDRVDAIELTLRALSDDTAQEGDALQTGIASLTASFARQRAEPSAVYLPAEFIEVQARLDAAKADATEDPAAARLAFQEAVKGCIDITTLMAQYDQLNQSAATARALAAQLSADHPLRRLDGHKDYALPEITERLAALEASMAAARAASANRPQTQADIEEIIAALRDLRPVLDAQLAYANARAPHETAHAELERDPMRYTIREVLTKARRHLDTAATRAQDRDHAAARTELDAAGITLDLARLQVMLTDNRPVMPQDVQAILAAPDGLDMLDEVVADLPPSVQREVMAVAFSARFGCTLEMQKPGGAAGADPVPEDQMNLPAPNLRRFYHEMSKLPQSDTLDNDSMLIFMHQSGDQAGSSYNRKSKRVAMREGDEARSVVYGLAMEHELGQLHADALPKPGQERTMFSWNTLHEVGHAVDDKLGYMRQHGEALAGWTVYGADVATPARAIADKFGFDPGYVAEYMLSPEGRILPIPAPDGCDPEEWRRRLHACRSFVDRARESNSPWASKSIADACVVGDYTYVESYKRNWARYRSSERAYGVSGYQFRAPGEWFSELYAAYHSDRMNDSHPHRAVIADL